MSEYGVILFHTTSSAIKAEKISKKEGFEVKLIPTPRQLSSDCGISLRFDWKQKELISGLLEKADVEVAQINKL
ncbi:MAG: DUF3343 domain-containing protein [Chloroflexi bacterium]|nr:DUF3343 domain-containing protein [Chloroflexota bacterium]MBM3154417.1 DUF3343 domain-containing protein [Chloroflexota bacterium]MBM3172890.1 DUF3343 domain-containing protein [Chloroflexota bacterium]MBM3175077.1 DUF3343 domain-containing protein [Chloroflexota bacterium]MBM4449711.1 DUF3343 domain-containing protein [Chloroflexota bacterium]